MAMKVTGGVTRRKDVPERLSISPSALGNKLNPRSPYFDPDFPKKIYLGQRSVGFLTEELDAWLEKRANKSEVQ